MSDDRSLAENIPRPDPSRLTIDLYNRGLDMQRRELMALREYLASEMNRIEKVHEEKFRGLETRFSESKLEGKSALDAALRAVTEANDKSERNFTKQIEANEQQTRTITDALSSQVGDVKERLTGIESTTKGAVDNSTKIMAAVIVVISILTLGFTITHGGTSPPTLSSPIVVPVQPK